MAYFYSVVMVPNAQRSILYSCDEINIIPFGFPPHTRNLLDPFDETCIGHNMHADGGAVDVATRTDCSGFNKLKFLAALHSIREQTFNRATVLSAFHQTGRILLNTDIVLR